MFNKQFSSTIKHSLYLVITLIAVFVPAGLLLAQCPANTEASTTQATLVGEVTDVGSDPNLTVWFEYGLTASLASSTPQQTQSGPGLFCYTLTGLTPATTYYYRAIARNSAGTDYGEIKSFTTAALPQSTGQKSTGQVAGAATDVSTGLTNNIWIDSFILPLLATGLIVWLLRSRLLNFEQWIDKRKQAYRVYKSEKALNQRLAEIKVKELVKPEV